MRRVRAGLEWLPIGLARRTVPHLSRRSLRRLAAVLGGVGLCLDRRGRRIARVNLRIVFGGRLTPRRERILLAGCYRNAALVLLEMFWFQRGGAERVRRWVSVAPDLRAAMAVQPAGIVVTGHLGNWEAAAQAFVAHGIPLTSVAKPIGSARTTERLAAARSVLGQEIVPVLGALRALLRALQRNRAVAILQDQYTDPSDGGVWVDFLGLPAAVSNAAAVLAGRTGAPVHVCACRALVPDGYRVVRLATVPLADGLAPETFTARLTAVLTSEIRRRPSHWLMMYKRWKRVPPGDSPERFPFYAKIWRPRAGAV
jgi:KDO2-lipid IV(A) lauroyltransferase